MRRLAIATGVLLGACTSPTPPRSGDPSAGPAATSTAADVAVVSDAGAAASSGKAHVSGNGLTWIEDDVPAALARAKAEDKLLFVDCWAEWCHTCISMKHYVLADPSLAPLAKQVIFAEVDTEKDKNAAFVDRYAIDVWPTFFVIDPTSGDVLGYWPGSGSVREMDALIREALEARDARRAKKLDPGSVMALFIAAKDAQASSRYDDAAKLYERALRKAPRNWPRRSEALVGRIGALFNGGHADECVAAGLAHSGEVEGAAMPTDFHRTLFDCAGHHPSAKKRQEAQQAAVAALRRIAAGPRPDATPDDRADTLHALGDMLEELSDAKGARAVHEQRLKILDQAAAEAPSPAAAATYDYGRANAYLSLGRGEEAVKMLVEREKQLPDSYDAPARLAGVLAALRRYPEALVAVNRALGRVQGPRRLGYLSLKARIQEQLGDAEGMVKTLEEEVAGHEAHAKRQAAKPQRLQTAQKRLEAAKANLAAARGKR